MASLQLKSQFLSGDNAQILVKGILVDENSGEPISAEIELRSKDGKKVKTQSNSITGKFEQLLPSGESYTVIVNSEEIIRKEFEFTTETADAFKEQETKWTAVKPRTGVKIFSEDIFQSGSSELSTKGIDKLKQLQMLLRFNRSLFVSIAIGGDDNLKSDRIDRIRREIDKWTREKSRIENVGKSENSVKEVNVIVNKIEEFLGK